MEHKLSTPDPEGLIPHGLVQSTSTVNNIIQKASRSETQEITLLANEIPLFWPAHRKWSSTIVVVLMTTTITFCASIHAAAVNGVAEAFSCSKTVSTLGVTTFMIGFATGPLLFAPLSEVWGRCLVFRITLFLFFCFNVGCALAPNIAALLVFRFLCGFFGSPAGKRLKLHLL